MSDIVKLEYSRGRTKELPFEHALAILRKQEKQGRKDFKVVGNHEFVNNELIIKPSKKRSRKSAKPDKGKKGDGLRESVEDIDPSV